MVMITSIVFLIIFNQIYFSLFCAFLQTIIFNQNYFSLFYAFLLCLIWKYIKFWVTDYPNNGLWRHRKLSDDTLESVNLLIDEELECSVETTDNLGSKLNAESSHNFEQLNEMVTEKESIGETENNDNQISCFMVEKVKNEISSQVTDCQVSEESSEDTGNMSNNTVREL